MATAPAEIACPARAARLLAMHVSPRQPRILSGPVDRLDRAHRTGFVAHEAMTRREFAVGGDTEIPRAGATGIRAMRSPMDLAHRVDDVRERIASAGNDTALELV